MGVAGEAAAGSVEPALTRPPPHGLASPTMPTPFTDAPNALLRLWNKFALRRGLDANDPPARRRNLVLLDRTLYKMDT